MRSLLTLSALLAGLLFAAACTTDPDSVDDAGARIEAGTVALVEVDRWESSDRQTPRLVAGAKVAEYTGIARDRVMRLLGADSLGLETCSLSGSQESQAIAVDAEVSLLDVGAIELEAGDLATLLEPRTFPAVGSTAAGVFYAVESTVTVPRAEDDEYGLRAAGTSEQGAFDLVMPAPQTPAEVRADGLALELGVTIGRDRDLELTWDAEDLQDMLELELSSGGEVVTCVCRDDGHLSVPARLMRELEPEATATMVVRRVRVQPFDMQGVDYAYARAASARAYDLAFR